MCRVDRSVVVCTSASCTPGGGYCQGPLVMGPHVASAAAWPTAAAVGEVVVDGKAAAAAAAVAMMATVASTAAMDGADLGRKVGVSLDMISAAPASASEETSLLFDTASANNNVYSPKYIAANGKSEGMGDTVGKGDGQESGKLERDDSNASVSLAAASRRSSSTRSATMRSKSCTLSLLKGKYQSTEKQVREERWKKGMNAKRMIRGISVMIIWAASALVGLQLFVVPVILLRLISVPLGRRFGDWLLGTWKSIWVLLFEVVNGSKFVVTGDDLPEGENALVMVNHPTEVDWVFVWCLALRKRQLAAVKYMVKSGLRQVPIFGWAFLLAEYLFVERNWAKDQVAIGKHLQSFVKHTTPLWMVLFPEGTDFTEAKRDRCQEHARSCGLPVLQHCLLPRYKGFQACHHVLHGTVGAVYDITIAYKDYNPEFFDLLFGTGPGEIHVHVRRFDAEIVPYTDDEGACWMNDRYEEKDEYLAHFKNNGAFPGPAVPIREFSPYSATLSLVLFVLVVLFGFAGFFISRFVREWMFLGLVTCMMLAHYNWLPR